MDLDAAILVRVSLATRDRARARYGTRGVGPRIRQLLEADLARDDQAHTKPPAQPAASKRPATTHTPETAAPRSGQPCPITGCQGTIRTMQGRPRCSAAPRHTWPS